MIELSLDKNLRSLFQFVASAHSFYGATNYVLLETFKEKFRLTATNRISLIRYTEFAKIEQTEELNKYLLDPDSLVSLFKAFPKKKRKSERQTIKLEIGTDNYTASIDDIKIMKSSLCEQADLFPLVDFLFTHSVKEKTEESKLVQATYSYVSILQQACILKILNKTQSKYAIKWNSFSDRMTFSTDPESSFSIIDGVIMGTSSSF